MALQNKRPRIAVWFGFDTNTLDFAHSSLRLKARDFFQFPDWDIKECYRWRSSIEATMSKYETRTGVKQLRVRGLKAIRFCATLIAVGVNIFRATAVRKAVWNEPLNLDRGHRKQVHCQKELEWRFFMATRRRFSNVFKRMVVEEYLSGAATQAQLSRRYNLSPHLIMR